MPLSQSASAQAGEEGATPEPSLQEPAPWSEPADEEGRSRLERWHPEAFVDPAKPAPEPTLQLGVDSAGPEVTPTASQSKKGRKRRVAIGVGVSLAVVGLIVGVGVGVSVAKINRGFD